MFIVAFSLPMVAQTFARANRGSDVAIILSKMVGTKISASEIRALLSNEEATGIALFWKKLGLFTRIRLDGTAPELLFIWKAAGASVPAVEYVIKKLVSGVIRLSEENKVAEYLDGLEAGARVWASALNAAIQYSGDNSAQVSG